MTTAFSSDGAQVIYQSFETKATENKTEPEQLDEVYQIEETCNFILKNRFSKVALQFPDCLLPDSAAVASKLETATGSKMYILGDTSYGSCCVDEVAAEHVEAQCIIHYGKTCLSPCKRLPVMYVFGRRNIDLEECAASFRKLYPSTDIPVIIVYDVVYFFIMGGLQKILQSEYPNVVMSQIRPEVTKKGLELDLGEVPANRPVGQLVEKFGRQFVIKEGFNIKDYGIFYVGQEGATLNNFMMTFNQCTFCSFDPVTKVGRQESVNINKALMKRYYLIERAKDANVFGILAGTLGVADYLSIIDHLKDLIKTAGRKSYLFVMGKLNVPKLANFLEIDMYVLVACPENSLLDSSDFYKPVITPFELEIAFNKQREWTGEYVTEFRDLLPGGNSYVEFRNQNVESLNEETDVSLITGNLRSISLPKTELHADNGGSSLVQRNQTLTMSQLDPAASFLSRRTWQGLEPKLGETPVTKAIKGRRGIAISYEDEKNS
ncbi:2-(3-amino-3-carboxypropyl)histidine synthase subunit 2 [Polypterus senegalus]